MPSGTILLHAVNFSIGPINFTRNDAPFRTRNFILPAVGGGGAAGGARRDEISKNAGRDSVQNRAHQFAKLKRRVKNEQIEEINEWFVSNVMFFFCFSILIGSPYKPIYRFRGGWGVSNLFFVNGGSKINDPARGRVRCDSRVAANLMR